VTEDICRARTGLSTPDALGDWNRMAASFLAHGTAARPYRRNAPRGASCGRV